jgi:hypothetical protein
MVAAPMSAFGLGRVFLEAQSRANWPSVIGTITKSQVGETEFGRYFADVAYRYRVADRDYEGSRIAASDGEHKYRDGAVQDISKYSVGKEVPVYYDKADPSRACLRVGAGFQEYALLAVPVFMLLYGIWLFRRRLR